MHIFNTSSAQQVKKMRAICSGCGESFSDENMDNCECGRTLCYRCIAIHKQKTGHLSTSDLGRFRVQLNEEFTKPFLNQLSNELLSYPEVDRCSNLALPQVVSTTLDLIHKEHGKKQLTFEMTRKQFEQLLNTFDNDGKHVQDFYVDRVTTYLKLMIAELNNSKS